MDFAGKLALWGLIAVLAADLSPLLLDGSVRSIFGFEVSPAIFLARAFTFGGAACILLAIVAVVEEVISCWHKWKTMTARDDDHSVL